MTETGWPLIPREVLPAPVPAAKRRPLPRPLTSDPSRQLPFFGAETTEPSPTDLAGLLAGPGRLGRMGGTARVTVEVDAAWRVHVLVAELVTRGLVAHWRPLDQDQADVRVDASTVTQESPEDAANHHEPDSPTPAPSSSRHAAATSSSRRAAVTSSSRRSAEFADEFAGDDFPPDDLPPDEFDDLPPEELLSAKSAPKAKSAPATPETPIAEPGDVAVDHDPVGQEPADPGAPGPDDAADLHDAPGADPESAADDEPPEPAKPRFEVLTAYSSRLNGLARAWPEAAAQLFLSGPRLRLWVAAAGEPIPGGYALGLDPDKDVAAIDAALVRAGLAGRLSADRQHYLIMGRRRLKRLAELVGERPAAAPAEAWPDGAGA